jgi:hypothetical protein
LTRVPWTTWTGCSTTLNLKNMKKRNFIFSIIAVVGICSLLLNCSKEEEDYCDYLTADSGPSISIPCSGSSTSNITNITYDQIGRVISYDFTIKCKSKEYNGSVYNVVYYSFSNVQSFEATINNKSCSYKCPTCY